MVESENLSFILVGNCSFSIILSASATKNKAERNKQLKKKIFIDFTWREAKQGKGNA